MSETSTTNRNGNLLKIGKELAKVGLGCVIGIIIGYGVSKLTTKNDDEDNLANDEDVMNYVTREGNVYIKQLSDIRLTTIHKFGNNKEYIKYLSSVSQCYFLKWIVSTLNLRRCIEIGIFTGSSTLSIALGIKSIIKYDNLHEKINPITNKLYNENNKNDYCLIAINSNIKNKTNNNNNNNNNSKNDDIIGDSILDDISNDNNSDNELFQSIARSGWKGSNVNNLIEVYGNGNENDIIYSLSEIYNNKSNHNSFDFAFINYGNLLEYKEYYTLLMKLIKNDAIILINHTLGEITGQTVDQGHITTNNSNNSRNKNSGDKNSSSGSNRHRRKTSKNISNYSMSSVTSVTNNKHEAEHIEIMDHLRSFNHKIVSDSIEKDMIESCMIILDNNTSMTLIKKLKRNVNIESSSNLLNRSNSKLNQ